MKASFGLFLIRGHYKLHVNQPCKLENIKRLLAVCTDSIDKAFDRYRYRKSYEEVYLV